jgi:hypothetical protein
MLWLHSAPRVKCTKQEQQARTSKSNPLRTKSPKGGILVQNMKSEKLGYCKSHTEQQAGSNGKLT